LVAQRLDDLEAALTSTRFTTSPPLTEDENEHTTGGLFTSIAWSCAANMDAAEADQDVKLQKISKGLLHQFDDALSPFLRKPDGRGGTTPRYRVRSRELFRLTSTVSTSHLIISLI
jgi:hypothetical protein